MLYLQVRYLVWRAPERADQPDPGGGLTDRRSDQAMERALKASDPRRQAYRCTLDLPGIMVRQSAGRAERASSWPFARGTPHMTSLAWIAIHRQTERGGGCPISTFVTSSCSPDN